MPGRSAGLAHALASIGRHMTAARSRTHGRARQTPACRWPHATGASSPTDGFPRRGKAHRSANSDTRRARPRCTPPTGSIASRACVGARGAPPPKSRNRFLTEPITEEGMVSYVLLVALRELEERGLCIPLDWRLRRGFDA